MGRSAGFEVDLRAYVRDVPDFPHPGITFKDITPMLLEPAALRGAIASLAEIARPLAPDIVVAAEARGFILGAALALELGAGFVPARKPGKLPHDVVSTQYELEYGTDSLEMHADAFAGGARVLLHDDLLATGGTARAVCELADRLGAEVLGAVFLVELAFLGGRARLEPYPVHSLIRY
jgi:adenine phosphoribosyltransferase